MQEKIKEFIKRQKEIYEQYWIHLPTHEKQEILQRILVSNKDMIKRQFNSFPKYGLLHNVSLKKFQDSTQIFEYLWEMELMECFRDVFESPYKLFPFLCLSEHQRQAQEFHGDFIDLLIHSNASFEESLDHMAQVLWFDDSDDSTDDSTSTTCTDESDMDEVTLPSYYSYPQTTNSSGSKCHHSTLLELFKKIIIFHFRLNINEAYDEFVSKREQDLLLKEIEEEENLKKKKLEKKKLKRQKEQEKRKLKQKQQKKDTEDIIETKIEDDKEKDVDEKPKEEITEDIKEIPVKVKKNKKKQKDKANPREEKKESYLTKSQPQEEISNKKEENGYSFNKRELKKEKKRQSINTNNVQIPGNKISKQESQHQPQKSKEKSKKMPIASRTVNSLLEQRQSVVQLETIVETKQQSHPPPNSNQKFNVLEAFGISSPLDPIFPYSSHKPRISPIGKPILPPPSFYQPIYYPNLDQSNVLMNGKYGQRESTTGSYFYSANQKMTF